MDENSGFGSSFLGSLGSGLQAAGAILSPDVLAQQNKEKDMKMQAATRQKELMAQTIITAMQNGSMPQEQGIAALKQLGLPGLPIGPTPQAQHAQMQLQQEKNFNDWMSKNQGGQAQPQPEGITPPGLSPGSSKLFGVQPTPDAPQSPQQAPQQQGPAMPPPQLLASPQGQAYLKALEAQKNLKKPDYHVFNEKTGELIEKQPDGSLTKTKVTGGEPPKERKLLMPEGKEVQQEWDDKDQKWKNVSEPVERFAKQIAPVFRIGDGGNDVSLAKDDETRRFMAEQYWSGDKSVFTNLGRGTQGAQNVIALRKEIAKVGKEKGKTPEDLRLAMAETVGLQAGERTLGVRQANIELAATVTNKFAPLAVEASEKFDRTGIKTLNDIEKFVASKTASPELRRFNAANNTLINAYARAINPQGVATVHDKEHAREVLDTGFSKGDYKAAVEQLQFEISAELEAPDTVKEDMRKRNKTSTEAPESKAKKVIKFDAQGNMLP